MGYSSMQSVFFRAFFMVAALWCVWGVSTALNPILPRLKAPKITAKKRGGFGGLFGEVAVSVAYYNFARIPLGIATAFMQSVPIFVVLLSFFTRFKPNLSTLMGFAGVLLVANPEHSGIPLANAILGIIGAIAALVAFLTIPALRECYTSEAVVMGYGLIMCLVGLLGMFVPVQKLGGFELPDAAAWGLFIAAGLVGVVGQWLMTKSYMFAHPSIVAPVSYLRIVFSVFLGVILGDFLPSLGIALILILGILVSVSAGKKR